MFSVIEQPGVEGFPSFTAVYGSHEAPRKAGDLY